MKQATYLAYSSRSTPYFFIIRISFKLFGSHCIKLTLRNNFFSWNFNLRTIFGTIQYHNQRYQNQNFQISWQKGDTCFRIVSLKGVYVPVETSHQIIAFSSCWQTILYNRINSRLVLFQFLWAFITVFKRKMSNSNLPIDIHTNKLLGNDSEVIRVRFY